MGVKDNVPLPPQKKNKQTNKWTSKQTNKQQQNNHSSLIVWLPSSVRIVIQQASSQADKKLSVVGVPIESNIRNSKETNQSYRSVTLLISRILEKKKKKSSETKSYFYKRILHLKRLPKRKKK